MDGTEALELARGALKRMTQEDLAVAVGVSGATISRWLDKKSPPSRGLSKLVAWAESLPPTPPPLPRTPDYERGVSYACEMMADTIARLLREQREAHAAADNSSEPEAAAVSPSVPVGARRVAR